MFSVLEKPVPSWLAFSVHCESVYIPWELPTTHHQKDRPRSGRYLNEIFVQKPLAVGVFQTKETSAEVYVSIAEVKSSPNRKTVLKKYDPA